MEELFELKDLLLAGNIDDALLLNVNILFINYI